MSPLSPGRRAQPATSEEVQHVIQALRAGGIGIVELHQHTLGDQPRLFSLHVWATADAIALAKTLHQAVSATNNPSPVRRTS